MKKIGLYVFELGAFGVLIGGCALDGPDYLIGMALIVGAMIVAAIGHQMYQTGKEREVMEAEARRQIEQAREEAFRCWMRMSTLH